MSLPLHHESPSSFRRWPMQNSFIGLVGFFEYFSGLVF